MKTGILESLIILTNPTFDGDLISKDDRDHLYKAGLIDRSHGFNFITAKGIEYLVNLRILIP